MLLKEENRLTERARAYASSAEHVHGEAARTPPPASVGGVCAIICEFCVKSAKL